MVARVDDAPLRVETDRPTLHPPFDPARYAHETVDCNLCGATAATVVTDTDRYGLPTRVVQCACGLQYLSPRMTRDGYAAFYEKDYRALCNVWNLRCTGRPYSLKDVENDQFMYATDLIHELGSRIREGSTLVDVGGSTGIVARELTRTCGYQATVIDPSADELKRAKGCTTIHGNAEDVEIPTVDLALLCRTIDHLLNPLAVLTRLRQAARWLVVDAMDVTYWPAHARYKVDHPYAFTKHTLYEMVTRAGWIPTHTWERRHGKYAGLFCT